MIGYVDLNDCLSCEEYKNKVVVLIFEIVHNYIIAIFEIKFPNGESESEFVFICRNPRELVVKIPMSGQHKICN